MAPLQIPAEPVRPVELLLREIVSMLWRSMELRTTVSIAFEIFAITSATHPWAENIALLS